MRVLTPEAGDAATTSCPCSRSFLTSFDPMSPVPPITTIFMILLSCLTGATLTCRLFASTELQGSEMQLPRSRTYYPAANFFGCGVPMYGNSFRVSVWGLRPVGGH